jgi:hypothetical protein
MYNFAATGKVKDSFERPVEEMFVERSVFGAKYSISQPETLHKPLGS